MTRKRVSVFNVTGRDEQQQDQKHQRNRKASVAGEQQDDTAATAEHSISHLLHRRPSLASSRSGELDSTDSRVVAVTGEHNMFVYNVAADGDAATISSEVSTAKSRLNKHKLQKADGTEPKLKFQRSKLLLGYNDEIIDIKSSPASLRDGVSNSETHNGHQLYIATNSTQIRCLDADTFDARLFSGHTDTVLSIDLSRDGRWLVSGSKDATVRVWNTMTGKCVAVCVGHTESISAVKIWLQKCQRHQQW